MTTEARSMIDGVIHQARTRTGLDDFGGDSWREGLEVLVCSAIADTVYSEFGQIMFRETLIKPLTMRLQIEDWYRRHPEIDEQEIDIELVGVGFPRTGSTALAQLLGEDTAFRNLRKWECPALFPPPGLSQEADDKRIAAAEIQLEGDDELTRAIRAFVPSSATGPVEDHELMELEFTGQTFLCVARAPGYAEWFLDRDMEPTYQYEKRVLKLLQWKTPQKVWRLKNPVHTLFLEAYEKVFPSARFVQTHRSVEKVLPSVCSLYQALLKVAVPDIDPTYIGELNMHQWSLALDRMLSFREDLDRDAKFFDMSYTAFQADQIGEIRRLYDWLGDEITAEAADAMIAWRQANPLENHGAPQYDADHFGLDGTVLREQFARYVESYGHLLR